MWWRGLGVTWRTFPDVPGRRNDDRGLSLTGSKTESIRPPPFSAREERRMRHSLALAAFGAAVLWGSAAPGALLNWEGTATVHLYPDDDVNAKFVGGGVATVNGTSGEIPYHLDEIRLAQNRGLISGSHTHFITDPEVMGFGLAAVRYVDLQGLTGTIGGSFETGRYPGSLPVNGIVHVCLLSSACTIYAAMPLTAPTTVNGVLGPKIRGLGVGGLMTIGGFGGIRISVQMAPWTIKTVTGQNVATTEHGAMVNSLWTMAGFAHGPQSESSSTAAPGGFIKLVTPAQISTNMPTGFGHPTGRLGETVGSVVSLSIRFVPEPGLWLMIVVGVIGLVILNRIRKKKDDRW